MDDDQILMETDGGSERTPTASLGDDALSLENEELALLLSEGLSQVAAARMVGISSKTVQRRLRDPAFRARVGEHRRERLAATTARLLRKSDAAVDTLEQLLESEDERLRLRAAQMILTLGRRQHREEAIEWDLAARMENIERLLGEVEDELK